MTEKKEGFFSRFTKGLQKTRDSFGERIRSILPGSGPLDDDAIDELEEILLTADIGVDLSDTLIAQVRKEAKRKKEITTSETLELLKAHLLKQFIDHPRELNRAVKPAVYLFVGINGSGKTTTIGKLASRFSAEGKKVLVGAGDTFRAAATEQLKVWAERCGADIVSHEEGSDPSALAYDTVMAGKSRGADIVLIDTAGRLHAKKNLMEELKKIHRVTGKALEGAPHEVILVLDGTTGQNAVQQAEMFHKLIPVTGYVVTKLDGSAKGGAMLQLEKKHQTPILYAGLGEKAEDLLPFSPSWFVQGLLSSEENGKGEDV